MRDKFAGLFFAAIASVLSWPPAAAQSAPFDLVWSVPDPNGLPANPQWAYRLAHENDTSLPDPQAAPCNGFKQFVPSLNSDVFVVPPGCVSQPVWWMPAGRWCGGHLNWQTVEYEGALAWDTDDGHSNSVFDDDDYNFWLVPSAGLTTLTQVSPSNLHLEFKARETVDHFQNDWWQSFHSAVDDDHGWVINTDYAIVIGMLGLDCRHSCSTEIHPVFAMAVHDPIRRSPDDDVWAIFVRNWGDEGLCASGWILDQGLTSIVFHLPWRPQAEDVTVGRTNFLWGPDSYEGTPAGSQVSGPNIQIARGNHVSVGFTLPSPISSISPGVRMAGEVHLRWNVAPDPCASVRTQLQTLLDELNGLYTGLSSVHADNLGALARAEEKIGRWHAQHDREVERLRQDLANCDHSRNPISTELAKLQVKEISPEKSLETTVRKLSQQKRRRVLANLVLDEDKTKDTLRVPEAQQKASYDKNQRKTEAHLGIAMPNPIKEERDRRMQKKLCQALGNRVPEFICR